MRLLADLHPAPTEGPGCANNGYFARPTPAPATAGNQLRKGRLGATAATTDSAAGVNKKLGRSAAAADDDATTVRIRMSQ